MNKNIIDTINEIDELEDDVREHINTTRYQNELIKDADNWNQICCSLDTINDTLCSISDYIESDYPTALGLKYLCAYGLLQALFIQQDALTHLSEAFKISYESSEALKKIRLLRNAAIGHPTKQDRIKGGHTYYNYISRITLSKEGFTLMRNFDQGKNEFIDVELYPIISEQINEIKAGYKVIVERLKEADKMHKEKFKGKLLSDIFHPSMGYSFQKIAQGIHSPDASNSSFGLTMLESVQETYAEFERALKERSDIDTYTQYDLNEYNHALSKLEQYFKDRPSNMTESDARIYHFYITESHKGFKKIAEEIDSSYK